MKFSPVQELVNESGVEIIATLQCMYWVRNGKFQAARRQLAPRRIPRTLGTQRMPYTLSNITGTWKVKHSYCGRSVRQIPLQNSSTRLTRKQFLESTSEGFLQKHREEMTKEAKRAALEECFRDRLGFTEFKDIVIDELNRPMNV